jgi:tetratricopeptide (TPR) repeat protein
MRRRHGATFAVVLGARAMFLHGVARAQEPNAEDALAEALYRQGRALLAEGKVAEACPKFAESYRLDAATGTLLNLAACHESEGKFAAAWVEFSRAAALARRDRRYDRVRFAQERLAVLEPKLSRLTVVVAAEGEAPGLEIRVDGAPVRDAARGVSTPVDAGSHTVEASAPGRKPWSRQVEIAGEAANVTVLVPALEPAAPVTPTAPEPPRTGSPETRPIPTSVYVAGGVTLALTAAAGATAYVYMAHRAEEGAEQREPDLGNNRRLGVINAALGAGALVGAGVTAYLYWTRPVRSGDVVKDVSLAPWIAPTAGGLVLRGSL